MRFLGLIVVNIFDMVPPILGSGEPILEDEFFKKKCGNFLRRFLLDNQDTQISKKTFTVNKKFGLVCRIRFSTPDDGSETINIILLWQMQNGDLAEFVGLDVQDVAS